MSGAVPTFHLMSSWRAFAVVDLQLNSSFDVMRAELPTASLNKFRNEKWILKYQFFAVICDMYNFRSMEAVG